MVSTLRAGLFATLLLAASGTWAQSTPLVNSVATISVSTGGLNTTGFPSASHLGNSMTSLGDLDNDGVPDMAVGLGQDSASFERWRAYILVLFMNANGTVKGQTKIGSGIGGFPDILHTYDRFAGRLGCLGDLDGDGYPEILAAASGDDTGGDEYGAFYVLFLKSDGTVKQYTKIASGVGGFPAIIDGDDYFPNAVESIGDLDNDGVNDIVCGESGNDDGGTNKGACYVLFMNSNGTVKSYQKISSTTGGLSPITMTTPDPTYGQFGWNTTGIGDLDNDGVEDIVASTFKDNNVGSMYVLFMNTDGTVKSKQKIGQSTGGLQGTYTTTAGIGWSVANMGDLDGDGIQDLAVGVRSQTDGYSGAGIVLLLYMNRNGTVKAQATIANNTNVPAALALGSNAQFGFVVENLGDLDGDGVPELGVGANHTNEGTNKLGRYYIFFLHGPLDLQAVLTRPLAGDTHSGKVQVVPQGGKSPYTYAWTNGRTTATLDSLAAGTYSVTVTDALGATASGSWTLATYNVEDTLPIVADKYVMPMTWGSLPRVRDHGRFGTSCTYLGNVDGDEHPDVAISCVLDSIGPGRNGSVYIAGLSLTNTRSVAFAKLYAIRSGTSGFKTLNTDDGFGAQVTSLGDVDGNGVPDIAVLAPGDDEFGTDKGCIYVIFLNAAGGVTGYKKIGTSAIAQPFGALCGIGDQNGDGHPDLLVGTPDMDEGGTDRGGFYILYLAGDGTMLSNTKVSGSTGWVGTNPLTNSDRFGFAATSLGDINGDGVKDLAVSTEQHDDKGSVFVLFMNSSGAVASYKHITTSQLSALPVQFTGKTVFGSALANAGDLNGDGTTDLFAGIQGYSDDATNDGGAIALHLNADGSLEHPELISEDSGAPTQNYFKAGIGANLGGSLAMLGDLNNDHVNDLLIGAPGFDQSGYRERGRAWVLTLNAKPFVSHTTLTAETDSAYGAIHVDLRGGVRPYTYVWGEDFPSQAEFDSVKSRFASYNWAALGLPALNMNSFTRDQLLAQTTPNLDSLNAGVYPVLVSEVTGQQLQYDFRVNYQITPDVSQNATLNSSNELVKTATSSSWTNMEFTGANILEAGASGYIVLQADDPALNGAVGVRPTGAVKNAGYHQMDFAFVLDADTIKYWYGGQLHDLGDVVTTTGKDLELSITDSVRFRINKITRTTVALPEVLPNYILDAEIYTGSGKIRGLGSSFGYAKRGGPGGWHWPLGNTPVKISPQVFQFTCGEPNAFCDLTYQYSSRTDITWEFHWSSIHFHNEQIALNGSPYLDPSWAFDEPGLYQVEVIGVSSAGQHFYGVTQFDIGYPVDWIERADCHTLPGEPNTLVKDNSSVSGGRAASLQEGDPGDDGSWVAWQIPTANRYLPLGNQWLHAVGLEDLAYGETGPTAVIVRWSLGIRRLCLFDGSTLIGSMDVPTWGDAPIARLHYYSGNAGADLSLSTSLAHINIPNRYPNGPTTTRVRGTILEPMTPIAKAVCSYSCGIPQRALMTDDLESGYHRAGNGMLHFAYNADYSFDENSHVDLSIHDGTGNVVASSALFPPNIHQGYNELDLVMTNVIGEFPTGFYWLEITDQKGIKQYLRFHYEHTAQ